MSTQSPVIVERDLGRGRDKGKVRAPRADLEEACADASRGQTGNLIALTHSPWPIEVSIGPMKKSSAGIDVEPSVVASMISAPSVTATSGISAEGSAFAIEPPMVPRLRVGGCPTHGSARASIGTDARITGSRSACAWRVVAPTTTAPFSSRIPASSGNRKMSISFAGRASRIASIGTSVCPPAMSRASSSAANNWHTCASESGLT